ncbi:MAG: TIGR03915 family putative DNA repair protein [Clostridium sp.]
MVTFLCRDEFNSILCGVYDAWMSRLGHAHVKLELEDSYEPELFTEYRVVEETEEKLTKVITAIRDKISMEAYEWIYRAALSGEVGKSDKIYRFLIDGFHYGASVTGKINEAAVYELFRMNRATSNEAHQLIEFVRFSEMKEKLLFSKIAPKNDVISLIAPHFADRLCSESWIIYDVNRKKAAVYAPGHRWLIFSADHDEWQEKLSEVTDEKNYETLWKTFCTRIAITERMNPTSQRNHLPLRYRPYMTEFHN